VGSGRVRQREEWRFFAVLRRAHAGLGISWWVLIVVRGLLPAAFAVSTGVLVGAVQRGTSVLAALIAVGVVFIVIQVLAPLQSQVGSNLGDRLTAWLNGRLLDATVGPPGIAHLESPELTDDLTAARDYELGLSGPPMSLSLGFIAGGLVQIVTGLSQTVLLAGYRWWAPLLVGGGWLATHWTLRKSTVWDRTTGEVRSAQRHADYSYRLAVDSAAAKELRLFGLSDWTVAQFAENRQRLVDLRLRATRLRDKPLRWTIGLLVLTNGLFFWSLATTAAAGRVSLAATIVFVQASVGASALAFGGLNWALPHAAGAVAAVLRLGEPMDAAGQLPPGRLSAGGRPAAELRFRDVSFGYSTGSAPVFHRLNLTIPAGSSLAIVGPNGAGKTTLIKLLCRLYDPSSGVIEVDGIDLRELDLASWRRQVTAVFQDFIRYELPLRENVAPLGGDDDAVTAALAEAGAVGLADLDTVLATGYDGGTDLSGGQWQRVALARALFAVSAGARLVILDEPTSQLDTRGEAEIFSRVLRATRSCTTILISHRFSTVRQADRICVLEGGRVVECGTHNELMAEKGRYHAMFTMQASQFAEEGVNGDVLG
jgi:ATP-binding cassette subfamily B protein